MNFVEFYRGPYDGRKINFIKEIPYEDYQVCEKEIQTDKRLRMAHIYVFSKEMKAFYYCGIRNN